MDTLTNLNLGEEDLRDYIPMSSLQDELPDIKLSEDELCENNEVAAAATSEDAFDEKSLFDTTAMDSSLTILTEYPEQLITPTSPVVKAKKRVHFGDDVSPVKCKKERRRKSVDIKQETKPIVKKEEIKEEEQPQEEIKEEQQQQTDDEEQDSEEYYPVMPSKSFTMENLLEHLLSAQHLLFTQKNEEAQREIDYLVRKCENRMSIRKRDEGRRSRSERLISYVHVYCGKRSLGVYNNSFETPKHVTDMVVYITINCGIKRHKQGTAIAQALRKSVEKYTYKCGSTHKKHVSVKKNKIYKCIDIIGALVRENNYQVVSENSDWKEKLEEFPDIQSESSD